MYLLNATGTVLWTLGKTPNVILLSDLSIITVKPDGSTSIVPATNLIAPTVDTQGTVYHLVTPDVEGLWEITLVKGPAETYTPLSKARMYVFDKDTTVEPLGYNPDSLAI